MQARVAWLVVSALVGSWGCTNAATRPGGPGWAPGGATAGTSGAGAAAGERSGVSGADGQAADAAGISGGVASDAAVSGGGGAPADARAVSDGGSARADARLEAAVDTTADGAVDAGEGVRDAGPGCATEGTELCEDFERGAIDPKIWGMHTTTGTSLTVDGLHAHGGTHALHVTMVAGGQGTAQLTDAVTFPAKNNTFYTRAWFYFSPDLPADHMGGFHMAYLLATGNNDLGFVEAGLGSAGNKQVLGYSEYYGAGPNVHAHGPTFAEFGPDSPTMIAPQRWTCFELMQGGDATTTHRRIWVDGNELPEQVSDYAERKPPQFSLMSIGVLQYHQTPLLSDVWIDDVRVSSARIGCGAAP